MQLISRNWQNAESGRRAILIMLKELIKSTLRGFVILAISPLLISHWLSSSISGADRSLESHSLLLSLFFPASLATNFASLSNALHWSSVTRPPQSALAHSCQRQVRGSARMSSGSTLHAGPSHARRRRPARSRSTNSQWSHGTGQVDKPMRLQPGISKRITISADCWIGANSLILADLAPGMVIGANSTVTRPHEPYDIAVGNPARASSNRKQASDKSKPKNEHEI